MDFGLTDSVSEPGSACISRSLILVHIPAGAGKSTLVAAAVDHIYSKEWREGTAILYYFFDFADGRSLEPSTVFNCFIKQLLQLIDPEYIELNLHISLEQTYAKGKSGVNKYNLEYSKEYVRQLCGHFGRVFFVIDGLDECAPNSRQNLLSAIRDLLDHFSRRPECMFKVLLASRPEIDIKEQIEGVDWYTIILPEQNEHFREDMEHYIRSKLQAHFQESNLLPSHEDLFGDLISRVVHEANGM